MFVFVVVPVCAFVECGGCRATLTFIPDMFVTLQCFAHRWFGRNALKIGILQHFVLDEKRQTCCTHIECYTECKMQRKAELITFCRAKKKGGLCFGCLR